MDNYLRICDIPKGERPIEKLLMYGAESLNNQELLAIILRCGAKGESVLSLSDRILNSVGGLDGLMNISYYDVTKLKGIKNVKSAQILALVELFKRFQTLRSTKEKVSINNPSDIAKLLVNEMSTLKQEVLKLIVLSTKNTVLREKDVFKGSLNSSIVHPREIYCEAIKYGGAAIIICHNHPSGDPTPSKEDINVTLRIKECGKIIGINLLDHIIIGDKKYVSLKEKGII